ncbi:Saccharopine dehydrogenase [NAD(+), L-lysine-forming] [Zancudomyces culisetae]|uniref:Saccharopine dehydrogenase [NAD(+), L-lysine-forming] n=1 Tax=Zancudomyces culisetae TaxID=1213189 RepID=A0A1R1PTK8_ZANCU|nr:Saccharopine dehydrogenase [NAD(+), L-lysine-forming] [Zancudomyces culisetae]|eukprot:OMH84259.1 Saccharopine dehydrogenase [NAD(+), L-lysine-forming] [Zancudomyces culisetae]
MATTSGIKTLVLRHETKPLEHRTTLSPQVCKQLIDQKGFKILVEKCNQRIFALEEYVNAGCEVVDYYWDDDAHRNKADNSVLVVGLKEFPEDEDFSLVHKHLMFAHCYKMQAGWQKTLDRFVRGGGVLYDLEFLVDPQTNRRVAAFGYYAGFSGCAIGIEAWCHQQRQLHAQGEVSELKNIQPYANEELLIASLKDKLAQVPNAVKPRVLVIGAKGRCGNGAVTLAKRAGITDVTEWDIQETTERIQSGSAQPFAEILRDYDIFVNCIYLTASSGKDFPPFIDAKSLETVGQNRRLSMVVDVSCDPTSPYNPLPVYSRTTTFTEPLITITPATSSAPSLQICAIDHLPTLLPRESSIQFSSDLLPSLLQLDSIETAPVWANAKQLFDEKVSSL